MGKILLNDIRLDNKKADILIEGNKIADVADYIPESAAEKVIDCHGMAAIPGLVNMHTHAAMTLTRGFRKENLQTWLQNIWAYEAFLDYDAIYWGSKLAILEMLKTGTTTFLDMYWQVPATAKAVEEMGIRACLTHVFLDGGDASKFEAQKRELAQTMEMSKDWPDRIRLGVAIHADYTNTEETMLWAGKFARDHGMILHAHVAETEHEMLEDIEKYGCMPVRHFENLGLIDENFISAHTVWINEDDIKTLGHRRASIVHNVNSNLMLGSGYKFKYNELRDAGANVCIGTDGAGSSDNLDLRETLKTTMILQKAWRRDPQAMPYEEAMRVATEHGARALGLDAGRIEKGALADIVLVDTRSEAFVPDFNFNSNLILAANSSCFDTVICDGRIVMEHRHVPGEEEILRKAQEHADRIMSLKENSKN